MNVDRNQLCNLRRNFFVCPDLFSSASRLMAGGCAGWVAGIKPGSFSLSWFFAREEPSDERICTGAVSHDRIHHVWPMKPPPEPAAIVRSEPAQTRYVDLRELRNAIDRYCREHRHLNKSARRPGCQYSIIQPLFGRHLCLE